MKLDFHPLTPDRWDDLARLFGARGACGGCWCMWWRLTRSEFERRKGAGNRRALRALVKSGREPGILAYDGGEPVGWCAVEPRERYPVLDRSRVLKPVDDTPTWSVTCFFMSKEWRGKGLSTRLLRAAAKHVKSRGGRVLEGYPHDLAGGSLPGAFVFTGLLPAFERAGFREVARRSPKRPIVRKSLR
jgi:GNAT superfamily N-acetyltransferase